MSRLALQPITLAEAKAFVRQHHSHHQPMVGWKFGVAVNDGMSVVGIAAVGRPVSRIRQQREPYTAEVLRVCTDETKHVASMLYAASARAAKALGYRRIITYILIDEAGTSLKAAGWRQVFVDEGGDEIGFPHWQKDLTGLRPFICNGGKWDTPSRPRVDTHPTGQKTLWEAG